LGWLGNFEKGAVFCEKGLHTASQIGELRTLAYNESYNGWFYSLKGDGRLVVEHFKNCIKYSEEAKWYHVMGGAFCGLGYGHYLLGDFENARNNIEKSIKILQDAGVRLALSFFYCSLSMSLFDLGEYGKALASIGEALILARKNNEKNFEGFSMIWLGRILGKTDPNQFDRAEESILKGINISEELGLKPYFAQGYLYLGEFYTDIAQKEKALENLKKAEQMFQEMGMDYWLAKTQEVLNRL
jgi:tetratricopeptide (TPR) repeat protein